MSSDISTSPETIRAEIRLAIESIFSGRKTSAEKLDADMKLSAVMAFAEAAGLGAFVLIPADWDEDQRAIYDLLLQVHPDVERTTGLLITAVRRHWPVQIEGEVNGKPFYFRARNRTATMTVVESGKCPIAPDDGDVLLRKERTFAGDVNKMPLGEAVAFIRKAVAFLV
jgi:hypothetical protein